MIKTTRVESRPGWVSFKLKFDKTKKSLSKEELIQSIKRRLGELNNE